MDIDLEHDPLGTDADGDPVYLADIWPDADEIHAAVHDSVDSSMFEEVRLRVRGRRTLDGTRCADR